MINVTRDVTASEREGSCFVSLAPFLFPAGFQSLESFLMYSLIKKITIFGKGNMGKAIGDNFDACGNEVEYAGREFIGELGDIIVLAVPYTAVDGILRKWGPKMKDKVLIDITNPVDFETMDHMLVPDGTSAAELIQEKAPGAFVVKAFNTNFANTLATGKVGFHEQTVVLMASDFLNAKDKVAEALTGCRLKLMDAGKLRRAREMEAMGFLQISLASAGKLLWTRGFAIID